MVRPSPPPLSGRASKKIPIFLRLPYTNKKLYVHRVFYIVTYISYPIKWIKTTWPYGRIINRIANPDTYLKKVGSRSKSVIGEMSDPVSTNISIIIAFKLKEKSEMYTFYVGSWSGILFLMVGSGSNFFYRVGSGSLYTAPGSTKYVIWKLRSLLQNPAYIYMFILKCDIRISWKKIIIMVRKKVFDFPFISLKRFLWIYVLLFKYKGT